MAKLLFFKYIGGGMSTRTFRETSVRFKNVSKILVYFTNIALEKILICISNQVMLQQNIFEIFKISKSCIEFLNQVYF